MEAYLIIKSLHVISVISWMAGLLYLPRIFVYHAENQKIENMSKTFKTMEHKLYFYIMTPAMFLTWILGIGLIHFVGFQKWLLLKILFVFALTIYHFFLLKCLNHFKQDANTYSSRFFRFFNEIPTILLVLIVFLVYLKPL